MSGGRDDLRKIIQWAEYKFDDGKRKSAESLRGSQGIEYRHTDDT